MIETCILDKAMPASFIISDLKKSIFAFESIDLTNIQQASLMDRIDTKFVFHQHNLATILNNIKSDYMCLEIDSQRIIDYETLYYDTKNFDFYLNHHNQRRGRYKIRSRKYVNNDMSFFEIKYKNQKAQTSKTRIITTDTLTQIDQAASNLLRQRTPIDPQTLLPQLWIYYQRMTLVKKDFSERVTLDLFLHTKSFDNQRYYSFSSLVVAEVKQGKFDSHSPFVQMMASHRVQQLSISKYCLSTAALYPNIKQNNFKKKQLRLNKIIYGFPFNA